MRFHPSWPTCWAWLPLFLAWRALCRGAPFPSGPPAFAGPACNHIKWPRKKHQKPFIHKLSCGALLRLSWSRAARRCLLLRSCPRREAYPKWGHLRTFFWLRIVNESSSLSWNRNCANPLSNGYVCWNSMSFRFGFNGCFSSRRNPNLSCDDRVALQMSTFLSLKTFAERNSKFPEDGLGAALVDLQVSLQGPNTGHLFFGGVAAGNHGLKMVAAGAIQWMTFQAWLLQSMHLASLSRCASPNSAASAASANRTVSHAWITPRRGSKASGWQPRRSTLQVLRHLSVWGRFIHFSSFYWVLSPRLVRPVVLPPAPRRRCSERGRGKPHSTTLKFGAVTVIITMQHACPIFLWFVCCSGPVHSRAAQTELQRTRRAGTTTLSRCATVL